MRTTSSYQADVTRIIGNTDSDTASWCLEQINDAIRYLISRYYFDERSYAVPSGTVAQQAFYNLPPQVKKMINVTISIGSVLWQPKECPSRQYWDSLNVIQFYQDFPSFFFVYDGQVGIFPIPASSGNPMTINYKTRVRDLSVADVTGTVSVTTNTATVTGTGFYNDMVNRWIRIAPTTSNTASGDDQWYQIQSVTNSTTLVLYNNYAGNTVTSGTATIGEVPILPELYQDLPLFRMAYTYYTTRFPDPNRAKLYKELYDEGMIALGEEYGSKTTNVILEDTDQPIYNPNLFISSIN